MTDTTGGRPESGDQNNDLQKKVVPLFQDAGVTEEFSEAEQAVDDFVKQIENSAARKLNELEIIRSEHSTLPARARAIVSQGLNRFPETKAVRKGMTFDNVPLNSDINRYKAFELLYGTGPDAPHLDEFSSRVRDGEGRIIDNKYPALDIMEALRILGMEGQSKRAVIDSIYDWGHERAFNDMQDRINAKIKAWDMTERIDESLINLFECKDTPLTRMASKQFWLSLYARIFHPGCMAPVVLCLIGTQNAGKSYFGKLICEEMMGNPKAEPIQMPMNKPMGGFLREITGQSVVANVGEMTGFGTADIDESKLRITKTSDTFDYKYEGSVSHPRQWILIMDGNKYEIQRDETGNRRFYPIFIGQVEDHRGKPAWKKVFSVDYSAFRENLWMYMAEAAAWFEEHGIEGYNALSSELPNHVFQFSESEMKGARGTTQDFSVETYLNAALLQSQKAVWRGRGANLGRVGVIIEAAEIAMRFTDVSGIRGSSVPHKKIKQKMESLGFCVVGVGGNRNGFLYEGYESVSEFRTAFFGDANSMEDADGVVSDFEGNSAAVDKQKGGF